MSHHSGKVNVPIMVASLFLSVILWVVVYSQNSPRLTPSFYPLKLSLQDLDQTKYIVTSEVPATKSVPVQATPERLKSLADISPFGIIDLQNASPGRRRYPVQVFPESVRDVFGTNPVMVQLQIEPLERKTFKITLDTQGELPDPTLKLDQTLMDPESIEVRGPQSDVRRVAMVRAVLDLSRVKPGSRESYTAGLEVLAEGNRPLPRVVPDRLIVRLTPVLSPAAEEKPVFVNAQFIGRTAAGYSVFDYTLVPNQITLSGRSLDLASITKVQTEPIDITGLSRDASIPVKLQIPRGVQASQSNVTARIRVRPLSVPNSANPPTPAPATTGTTPGPTTAGTTPGP